METNKFYVGQKVVYITGSHMPKNSIHRIKALFLADCGCLLLDVGTFHNDPPAKICADCSKIVSPTPHGGYFHYTAFRPLSERSAESEAFSEETIEYLEKEIKETYIPS